MARPVTTLATAALLAAGILAGAPMPVTAADDDCVPFVRLEGVAGGKHEDQRTATLVVGHEGPDCSRLNHAPLLLGGRLHPELGPPQYDYEFYVTYVDFDNDPPAFIEAIIDSRPPLALLPWNPSDTNYVDGALYIGVQRGRASGDEYLPLGPHTSVIRASDGHQEAEPVHFDGPIAVDVTSASLRAPNPTNRLLIRPIANGPTLVPPVEVLPPLEPVAGALGNGYHSYAFELGPDAGRGDARFVVSTGEQLEVLDGFLEGPPGADYELLDAEPVPHAHTGLQAIRLAASGDLPGPTGSYGRLVADPRPGFAFTVLAGLEAHYHASAAVDASLRLGVLLDVERDGVADLCLAADVALVPGAWASGTRGGNDPFTRYHPDCRTVGLAPGAPRPVVRWQDDPLLGLSNVVGFHASASGAGAAWRDGDLVVDDLRFIPAVGNSVADMDVCFYRRSTESPVDSFTPVGCHSDIGPHGDFVPAGATHGNVWAHTITPVLSEDLTPRRSYLEPAGFSFHHRRFVLPFEPEVPPPPRPGSLHVWEDRDGDRTVGPGDTLVATFDDVPARAESVAYVATLDLSGRPDGVFAFLAHYAPAAGPSALVGFDVPRFVNDAPQAWLSVWAEQGQKRAAFRVSASDPDDAQGSFAAGLGGLERWRLEFGDGEAVGGVGTPPACISHKYQRTGSYQAALTVVDRAGATASTSAAFQSGALDRDDCP